MFSPGNLWHIAFPGLSCNVYIRGPNAVQCTEGVHFDTCLRGLHLGATGVACRLASCFGTDDALDLYMHELDPVEALRRTSLTLSLCSPCVHRTTLGCDVRLCCLVPLRHYQYSMHSVSELPGALQRQIVLTRNSIQSLPTPFATSLTHCWLQAGCFTFLDQVEQWICCFGRSMLAYYFLAILHLLFWCIPCRAGKEHRNRGLKRMRGIFRGAPILWALFFVSALLPICVATRRREDEAGEFAGSGPLDGERLAPSRDGPARVHHIADSIPLPPDVGDSDWDAEGSDFKLQVVVVQFQRPCFSLEQWWDPGLGSSLLCAEVVDELDLDLELSRIIPVCPQPSIDAVVVMEVPPWLIDQMVVPVLIQVGEPFVTQFLEYFTGRVCYEDIWSAAGERWIPGAHVYVGDSPDPLEEHADVQVVPGMLIRISARRRVPAARSLDHKLHRPRGRLRNLVWARPREFDNFGPCVGLIGPLADWQTFSVDHATTVDEVRAQITERCTSAGGSVKIKTPCELPYDLAFRGAHITSLVGVVPPCLEQCVCLFIDPRALGRPVCLVPFPPVPTTITALLSRIQASYPDHLQLIVKGAPCFVRKTQLFTPGHAAVINLSLERIADENLDWQPEERMQKVPPRPIVQCRDVIPSGGQASQVGDDRRSEARCHRSSTVVLSLEADAVWRAAHPDGGPAIIERASTGMPRDGVLHEEGPIIHLDDDGHLREGLVEALSEEEGEQLTAEEEEWLLLVRVMCFQQPSTYRSMWVSTHDTVDSFMTRARILLTPVDGFFELHLPQTQPDGGHLTVILTPIWWRVVSLHVILVINMDPDSSHFATVLCPDAVTRNYLPCDAQRRSASVNIYTDFVEDESAMESWPHPPVGSAVVLQDRHLGVPRLPSPDDILANRGNAIDEDDVPSPRHDPETWYGLLGDGFEHNVIQLQEGALSPQISRAINVDAEGFSSWVQLAAFERLEIHGRQVGRCIGYRCDPGIQFRPVTALFIDGRLVGKPVCLRCTPNNFLDPAEVLGLIDVVLPAGYRAMQVRVGSRGATAHSLLFLSGQSVVMWAERVGPFPALGPVDVADDIPSDPDEDADSSDGDEDDDSLDDVDSEEPYVGVSTGRLRSRSPRRGNDAAMPQGDRYGGGDVKQRRSALPTPCRAPNLRGLVAACSYRGDAGQSITDVHHGMRQYAKTGAALAAMMLDDCHDDVNPWFCRLERGDFFEGDVGIMWMPSIVEHARVPCLLADTPVNSSPQEIHSLDCCTLLEGADPELRGAFLQKVMEALCRSFTLSESIQEPSGVVVSHAPHCVGRRCVALCDLIPLPHCAASVCGVAAVAPTPEAFQLDAGQCVTPWSSEHERDLTQFVPFGHLRWPPAGLDKPERFSAWVSKGVRRSLQPAELLCIVSDGSHMPRDDKAGWGVVFAASTPGSDVEPTFLGCCWGTMDAFRALPSDVVGSLDAFKAEIGGLFWAAVAVYQLHPAGDICFRCDNISALGVAQGCCQALQVPIVQATRALHLGLAVGNRSCPSYEHVRGHSGDPANELADALAEFAAHRGRDSGPFMLGLDGWFVENGLVFQWAVHAQWVKSHPCHGPGFHDGVLAWDRSIPSLSGDPMQVIEPFLPQLTPSSHAKEVSSCLAMRLATFNCLSAIDAGQGAQPEAVLKQTGRAKLLALSLGRARICMAGLQESRESKGVACCGTFQRLISGADKDGNYGTELWFDTARPFGWTGDKPQFLSRSHFSVIFGCPTFLIVRLSHCILDAMILVGHAPHRAHAEGTRVAWWTTVTARCAAVDHGGPWLLMLDANARVGSRMSAQIGGRDRDDEDCSGLWMHELFRQLRLFAPSTFDEFSVGPSGTVCQRRNLQFARGDFLGIPEGWKGGRLCAFTDPEISAGHRLIDHVAAVVAVEVPVVLDSTKRRVCSMRVDHKAMFTAEGKQVVQQIVDSIPDVGWDVNVHEHCAVITKHLQSGLCEHFPVRERRMRADYFSEHTNRLHQTLCTLRNQLRRREQALRWTRLRCAFLQWSKREARLSLLGQLTGAWLSELHVRIAVGACHLKSLAQVLKRSCRADKIRYLQELAEAVGTARPQDIHRSCRRLLQPKKMRGNSRKQLPCLLKSDGIPCISAEETMQCWRSHFGALEAGQAITPAELVSSCVAKQGARLAPERIDVRQLPTMQELEEALRQVAPNKATGPDCLPTKLCRVFCGSLCVKIWPLMLKTLCRACEPVGHKGGVLYHLLKPGGDPTRTTGYRGVLAQSALAKVAQKVTRRLLVQKLEDSGHPFRIGGRKGFCAGFGSLMVRGFIKFARHVGCTAGVLFVDITAAYYCLIRQLVNGTPGQDAALSDIVSTLGMCEADLQALTAHACADPVLADMDSELLRLLALDFHDHTWQVLHGDSQLTCTRRGSRPGSSWADALFACLFEKVLERRETDFRAACFPQVPWDGRKALSPVLQESDASHSVKASEVIYADDLAVMALARQAITAGLAMAEIASSLIDVFGEHGFRANFGRHKTAAIVSPCGPGSRQARQELFFRGKGRIPVLSEHHEPVWLDFVPSYKHLGTIVDHRGSVQADVLRRVALARVEFRAGRKAIYANPHIPLQKRVNLFKANVLGVLLYGAGTWPWLLEGSFRVFSGAVLGMYRQLVRIRHDAAQNWSRRQLSVKVRLPLPQTILSVERLRFLRLMIRSGPEALWAIIRYDSAFVKGVQAALRWLFGLVSATCPMPDPDTSWDDCVRCVQQHSNKFKGWVKRAEAIQGCLDSCQVAAELAVRNVWSVKQSFSYPCDGSELHACIPCGVAFDTRQSWGAHASRKHGYRARHCRVSRGRSCVGCGKIFASEGRLRRHLAHMSQCLAAAEASAACTPEMGEGHAQAPPVQVGPALAPALDVGAMPELCELIRSLDALDPVTMEGAWALVQGIVCPLPEIRAAIQGWGLESDCPRRSAIAGSLLEKLHPSVMGARRKRDLVGEAAPEVEPVPIPQLCMFPVRRASCHSAGGALGQPAQRWVCHVDAHECCWQQLAFPEPPALSEALKLHALWIALPAAPCLSEQPWIPQPGSLKAMRSYERWASTVLLWIELGFRSAYHGLPVHIALVECPGTSMWLDWALECGGFSGIGGSASLSFTRIHVLH